MIEDIIHDYDGREIKVGTRVRMYNFDPLHPDYGTRYSINYTGIVTDAGSWDIADDEGRPISIPPYVQATFDNGDVEHFQTSEWEFIMGHGKIEELCACTAPKVGHVKLREAS